MAIGQACARFRSSGARLLYGSVESITGAGNVPVYRRAGTGVEGTSGDIAHLRFLLWERSVPFRQVDSRFHAPHKTFVWGLFGCNLAESYNQLETTCCTVPLVSTTGPIA